MTSTTLPALVAVVGLAVNFATPQPPTFRAETRLVVLRVTVTNRHGELVTNLDRGAFSVYEDGRQQSIALFRRDDAPVSIGLIIDNSGSMQSVRPRLEAAALALVRASNPLDEAFVLNFADRPNIDVPFTSDVQKLEAGVVRRDSIGGTAVHDAILIAERYLSARSTHERRALLVISDGNDNASITSASELRKIVERSDTAVFYVSLPHRGRGERSGDRELERLVESSGGVMRRVESIEDVDKVVLEIAHQIRNEYTIAYTPSNQALDGSFRSVRVKVTGSGAPVARTRPGYWATRAASDR
jgi:VWFA-related protein